MATKRTNGNNPPSLAELQAQREALAGRLEAVGGQLQRLDPVKDWKLCALALGEQAALERALQALGERIEAALLVARDASNKEIDAAQLQRQIDALAGARAAARDVVAELQRLEGGAFANLDAALAELRAAGAYLPVEVAVMVNLRGGGARALVNLRSVAPTWLGLPQPETPEARDIREAKANLQRAGERLAWLKKTGAFDNREEAISQAMTWQRTARARLAVLSGKDPELLAYDVELAALEREAPALVSKKSPAQIEAWLEDQQRKQLAY